MDSRLTRLDRIFQRTRVGVDRDHRPAAVRLAEGLWYIERRLSMPLGVGLPSRTTIVRHEGAVTVISPPPPHEETFAAIESIGKVEALVAPNSFHYLFVNSAAERYPDAKIYLAPGLQRRIAELPAGADLCEVSPSPDIDRIILGPIGNWSEALLFHRPSRTLILSDTAFNLANVASVYERLFWRAFGVPKGFGPSRTAKFTLLSDRAVAGAALRRALDWPFERILVAHGDVVQTSARARFDRAFKRYLESQPSG
jgi:hypothetical protein